MSSAVLVEEESEERTETKQAHRMSDTLVMTDVVRADPTGLEPAISGVTGRRVGRYTTGPGMLRMLAPAAARTTKTVPYGDHSVNSLRRSQLQSQPPVWRPAPGCARRCRAS